MHYFSEYSLAASFHILIIHCFGPPVLAQNIQFVYDVNKHCNPPNNFFGLSLDKTDHMIQNGTMVIRRYPPFNLISVISFHFDGIKAKK